MDGGLTDSIRLAVQWLLAPLLAIVVLAWLCIRLEALGVFAAIRSAARRMSVFQRFAAAAQPTNFQAEFFADGSFVYRYPDRSETYPTVLSFDYDCDGLENSVDPVVVARAGEVCRVPLVIGVEYAVTSSVPFTVSPAYGCATGCERRICHNGKRRL